MGGELADESNGVGEQEWKILDYDFAHSGAERGKEFVFGKHIALAQKIHQGRLAHIGIAHEGHTGELAYGFCAASTSVGRYCAAPP